MLTKTDRSNLAGEFYVLAELYRRGYNAFVTLGKAKQIDIVVLGDNGNSLAVEVKARITAGAFLCKYPTDTSSKKIWVFVDLYKKTVDEPPDYYVVSCGDMCTLGKERLAYIEQRGQERGKPYSKMAAYDLRLADLKRFAKGWELIKTVL